MSHEGEPAALRAALHYANAGLAVFPCMGKTPCTAPGLLEHGVLDATTDEAQLRAMWERWPRANVAIRTGAPGPVVIDVDTKNRGVDAWGDLRSRYRIPETLTARTPSGGFHEYFEAPETEVRNSASKLANGVDIRGAGGYVVAPPSIGGTGRYRWLNPDVRPVPFPDILVERLKTPRLEARRLDSAGGLIAEGMRNVELTSLAGAMRRRGMTDVEIEAALQAVNLHRCNPPLADHEIRRIAQSVGRYAPVVQAYGPRLHVEEVPYD